MYFRKFTEPEPRASIDLALESPRKKLKQSDINDDAEIGSEEEDMERDAGSPIWTSIYVVWEWKDPKQDEK